MSEHTADNDALTERREAVRREAAHMLWTWGWYDLAEVVAPTPADSSAAAPVPHCRQFWRYTGQGEAPEQVAMECNVHGVIDGMTAADPEDAIADAWADHLRVIPPGSGVDR